MVMQLKGKLNYCKAKNEGRKIYYKKCIIKTNIKPEKNENKKDYYIESINALIEYMKKYGLYEFYHLLLVVECLLKILLLNQV